MKISYCVTVADEEKEVNNITTQLLTLKREVDEVVVLLDLNKTTEPIIKYLDDLYKNKHIILYKDNFDGDFAFWKNKLFEYATGDFIFQIDCDEVVHPQLLSNLHILLESNPDVDLYALPRINIVNGAGESHFKKYQWKISTHSSYTNEFNLSGNKGEKSHIKWLKKNNLLNGEKDGVISHHIPLINFPDFQGRIFRNDPNKLQWIGKVHEMIGSPGNLKFNYSTLPLEEEYCLLHIKEIEKQEKQNSFYDTL
jgi:glycosyltransferase involved in cell wall biosynthesis